MNHTQNNLAWKLNWYRQSELEGALLLGRMIGMVEDSHLIHELTQHAAEEAEHSRLWEQVICELKLPHIRIYRSYQSFYLNHTGPPASLLDVLCFTQIFERRVHQRFTLESANIETPEPARAAYQRMIDDEKGHLGWVAEWLRSQPESTAIMQRYLKIDQQVFQEILPYENHLYDIPGLGQQPKPKTRQLYPANN